MTSQLEDTVRGILWVAQPHSGQCGMTLEQDEVEALAEHFALFPPVAIDDDLLAARDIVKATLDPDSHKRCHCRDEIDAGRWDRGQKVRATIAGIRYGRAQQRLGGTT